MVGQIFKTRRKQQCVYTLVAKEGHSDRPNICVIRNFLRTLKADMQAEHNTSFRISKVGDITETLAPGALTEALCSIFENSAINVTVCYGKTVIPPENERKDIIKTLHDSLIGGHKGFHQTYNKIRERYVWKGMRNGIQNFIRTCNHCQESKIHRAVTRTEMLITDTPLEPFEKVSIDLVGPLKTTSRGNRQLLTMQCHLTKFIIAVTLSNMKATTIADALAKYLICQFGAPKALLSDNGTSFVSEIVRELLHILRIRQLLTSTYHPASNGQLERSHGPLKDFIRCYSDRFSDWDKLVPFATFTYNTLVHSATNFTPFELVYGRIARFPLKIPTHEKLLTYNVYLQDLISRLNELHVTAGRNIIKSKERSKQQYDIKSRTFKPRVGQYVRALIELRTNNAEDYYADPCRVIKVLSDKNVIIELPGGEHVRKHVDKLQDAPLRAESDY